MQDCPYNNTCIKFTCDLSCSEFSEFMHWMNRCNLSITNPAIRADLDQIQIAEACWDSAIQDYNNESSYLHLNVLCVDKPQFFADLLSYVAICKYCKNIGFYNGVYKLNLAQYLEDIKKSWNSRIPQESLDDIKIWINSSKYLVISNLGLIRFGDFESQTLLSILQERYDQDKYTVVVLEKGKFGLLGKSDSIFYQKLKNELMIRGAKL